MWRTCCRWVIRLSRTDRSGIRETPPAIQRPTVEMEAGDSDGDLDHFAARSITNDHFVASRASTGPYSHDNVEIKAFAGCLPTANATGHATVCGRDFGAGVLTP